MNLACLAKTRHDGTSQFLLCHEEGRQIANNENDHTLDIDQVKINIKKIMQNLFSYEEKIL